MRISKRSHSWLQMVMLAFVTTISSSGIAEAYSPKQPEAHHRHSPNKKYYLDYDPQKGHLHVIRAAEKPDVALWSFKSDALWPYQKDESDGCLFVANDGSTVCGLTWIPVKNGPAGHRIFEGLEFWQSLGSIGQYRISELPAWRICGLDLPVFVLWSAIHGTGHRGQNMSRDGDRLKAITFGMRSFTFSLQTGQRIGSSLNLKYFVDLALIYAPPVFALQRWARFRQQRRLEKGAATSSRSPRSLFREHLGTPLVLTNTATGVLGVFFDSFGGEIDHVGALLCRFAFPMSFWLVPVTVLISIMNRRSRRAGVDIVGPWLAMLVAAVITTLFMLH